MGLAPTSASSTSTGVVPLLMLLVLVLATAGDATVLLVAGICRVAGGSSGAEAGAATSTTPNTYPILRGSL
jgi:hypothetical protein